MEELQRQLAQLEEALGIISNRDGDYTQNLVNDALYEVGYYTDEEEDNETT